MTKTINMLIASIIILTGCATSAGFNKKMDKMIGITAKELVVKLGAPTSEEAFRSNGKVLQYDESHTLSTSDEKIEYESVTQTNSLSSKDASLEQSSGHSQKESEAKAAAKSAPANTLQRTCVTRFLVDAQGIVRAWSANGNNCKAQE